MTENASNGAFQGGQAIFQTCNVYIQLHCNVTIHHPHKNRDITGIQHIKFQEEGPEIINKSDQDDHTKS